MNWWEELELETETEKRLQAEVERLRAVNARLLAACEYVLPWFWQATEPDEDRGHRMLRQAIADAKGQSEQPASWKLPGLE